MSSRSLLPHRATSHLTAPWKWLLLNQKLPANYQVQWPLAGSWHSRPLFGPWLLRVSLSPQATFPVHTVVSSQCPVPRLLVSDPRLTSPARSSSPPRLPVPFTPLPDRGARLPSCILGIRCPRNGLISLPLLPPLSGHAINPATQAESEVAARPADPVPHQLVNRPAVLFPDSE